MFNINVYVTTKIIYYLGTRYIIKSIIINNVKQIIRPIVPTNSKRYQLKKKKQKNS